MEGSERRRHARIERRARITCQEITYPLGSAPELEAEMVDVSEGGVRLLLPRSFEPDTPLQVALELPGWHRHTDAFFKFDQLSVSGPLTAVGRVVRVAEPAGGRFDVGVEFLDIWEDHWRAMRAYLREELARRTPEDPS